MVKNMTESNMNKTTSRINLSELTSKLMRLVLELSTEEKIALLRDLEDRVGVYKRKSPRMPYLAEVDFAMNGKPSKGFIANISESGIYIESSEKPKEGIEITMAFPPPSRNESVKVKGRVVRTEDGGFAVEFSDKLNSSLSKYGKKIISDTIINKS